MPGYTFVPGVGILGESCDLPTSACPNEYRDIQWLLQLARVSSAVSVDQLEPVAVAETLRDPPRVNANMAAFG